MKSQQFRWVILAFVLAACGSGQPDAADATGAADDSTTTTVVSTTVSGSDSELTSLADFYGYGGTPEEQQELFRQQETEIQESIRSCMAEQGFEYIPFVYDGGGYVDFEFDEREWAETQGFGISTWYNQEETSFEGEPDFVEDPNQELIEAMSESEQAAYFEALYGDEQQYEPTYDEEGNEIFEYSGFGSGCQGIASEEVYGNQDALYTEFSVELDDMYAKIESDPRIVDMQAGWASCMADAGYTFDNQEDMWTWLGDDFQLRVDEVLGQTYFDPFEGWSEEEINQFFESKTDEEIQAFFQEGEQQSRAEVDEEALAALNKEEIDLALANLDCSAGFQDTYREVSEEYEADFINQNRTRLEELRSNSGNG